MPSRITSTKLPTSPASIPSPIHLQFNPEASPCQNPSRAYSNSSTMSSASNTPTPPSRVTSSNLIHSIHKTPNPHHLTSTAAIIAPKYQPVLNSIAHHHGLTIITIIIINHPISVIPPHGLFSFSTEHFCNSPNTTKAATSSAAITKPPSHFTSAPTLSIISDHPCKASPPFSQPPSPKQTHHHHRAAPFHQPSSTSPQNHPSNAP